MKDYIEEPETSSTQEAMVESTNRAGDNMLSGSDSSSLIHPSFPPMGVITPSHLGPALHSIDPSSDHVENYPYSISSPSKALTKSVEDVKNARRKK